MKEPCPRRTIISPALTNVNAKSTSGSILARPEPLTLTWLQVADFRECLLAMPMDKAKEMLRILERSLGAKRQDDEHKEEKEEE
ncbi:MAG: hypothetical protein HONBIEJF_02521 [Fimbriimonadaceae bacterium]|nr:hypothetical protein [Fimbriimonadaceae bacterium]